MGLFNQIGEWLNDLTGITGSAKQQAQANLEMQKNAQNFAKWQMGNAHQQEVTDLQAAGLNPVLSANGGTSAGVSGGTTGAGVSGADPISLVMNMVNTAKTADKIDAEIKKLNTDTGLAPQIAMADIALKGAQAGSAKAKETYDTVMTQVDKDLKKAQTTKTDKETPYGGKTLNTARAILSLFK